MNNKELEVLKEKFQTGNYICMAKWEHKSKSWYKQKMSNPFDKHLDNATDIKLIDKKDEDVLEAYNKSYGDIEIEYFPKKLREWCSINIFFEFEDDNWIDIYNEYLEYRVKPKETNECEDCGITIHSKNLYCEECFTQHSFENLSKTKLKPPMPKKVKPHKDSKEMINLNNTWCKATEENYYALVRTASLDVDDLGWHGYTSSPAMVIINKRLLMSTCTYLLPLINYRQIHLVDKEFQYVKEEDGNTNVDFVDDKITDITGCATLDSDKNNMEEVEGDIEVNSFTKYNFETPEFEGEIYEEYKTPCGQTFYNGYVWDRPNDDYHYKKLMCWGTDGRPVHYNVADEKNLINYNLTPIKKPWYEDESNIGKLCIDTRNNIMFKLKDIASNDGYLESEISLPLDSKQDWEYIHYKDIRKATKEEVLSLLVQD